MLLVGLAVLLLIAPGIVGQLAENRMDAGLGAIDLANENVGIEAKSFERGWFSSVGQHRIDLLGGAPRQFARQYLGADPKGGDPALLIDTRLDHGFVPLSSLKREGGSLAPGLVATVSTIALDRGDGEVLELPARIHGRVGLGGNANYRIVIDAGGVAFSGEEAGTSVEQRTEWAGSEIDYLVSANGKILGISGHLGSFSHTSAGMREAETVGRVDFRLQRNLDAHPLGESEVFLAFESLSSSAPSRPEFRVAPLEFHFENRIADNRTSGSSEWAFAVEGVQGQPGFIEFSAKLGFENLDADALVRAREAWQALNDSNVPHAMSSSLPAADALEQALESLAASGGRLNIKDANLVMPSGDLHIESMSVELTETAYTDAFNWPAVLLGADIVLEASLSAEFVEELQSHDPRLNAAVAGGFLVKNGDRYRIRAALDDGQLRVNGAPLPLTSFIN